MPNSGHLIISNRLSTTTLVSSHTTNSLPFFTLSILQASMRKLSKTSFLLIVLTSLFSLSTAVDILTPDRPLLDGETMISAGGIFALGFFTPSNSSKNRYVGIWYNKISTQTVLWVANRNNPIAGSNASLSITSNGTLAVTDNNSTVMWSSSSTATTVSNPIAQILDTGNFIVKDADNGNSEFYAWQSFDYPTDTLLPGMKLGWNLTIGLNRNLTSWASLTDPSTGSYNLFLDISGDPQMFLGSGTTRTWRSGPWNGEYFIGIPEMKTHGISTFNFVQNSEEVYIQFHFKDPTVISLLNVNKDGSFQRLVWLDQPKTWKLFWSAPRDQCDTVSTCGPFGVCNPNDSPICACVQGFVPQNQGNWDLWDWTDGCVRKTPLDCRNGTDKFMTITDVKLPDTSSSTMDMSPNRDQCMAKCLANCSCTAYARSDIYGTGSGCLIWTSNLTDLRVMSFGGQDLYVRLAAVDLVGNATGGSHGRHGAMVVIVLNFVGGALLLTCVCCFLWRRKKRRGANISVNKEALDLPLFDFSTIATATNNFSDVNKLGQGGFGPVYKGNLGEDQEIAIKRLAKTSLQGVEEFKNEVVLIAKLQHRNLVRLLGCCIHGEERMLIYEYMPNGSLDSFLFEKGALLDWKTRYQIIIGITRGLLYLHHDSRLRIIHRDLKPSNILLDNGMNPKISDFGMARIFGGDEMTDFNTRKVVGTYGYMSPEYAMEGVFSMKSDVFSFGVLLLEIVSGRKNRGEYTSPHLNLVAHAWSLWNEGKSLQLVHESMGDWFSTEETLKCIKVGLLCVQERPEERPLMSSVVIMLGNESDIASLPTPKQPGFIACTTLDSDQPSSTVNDLTVSLYGR